ncbi:hypothetical protein C8Q77DRAFT_240827 [Trametes polyzona]|nr:hypothetical protein C8Q77DRAFT_240827 [Trametes polyzona]
MPGCYDHHHWCRLPGVCLFTIGPLRRRRPSASSFSSPTRSASMAAFTNVTIDDSSSLILYDPSDSWTSPSGSDAGAYANSTAHTSSVSGATAKFTFTGTGVWLYGAKKPGYGSYILVVDNEVVSYSNAGASDASFRQLLGGVANLGVGEHVVTIMNGGSGPIDLDTIVYEAQDQSQQYVFHLISLFLSIPRGGREKDLSSFPSSSPVLCSHDSP